MLRDKTVPILAISIPIVFTAGIICFFLLLPTEAVTLANFISYMSSLSTILMVLVVILATRQQVKEMENTRVLQNQPLPYASPLKKSHLEAARFFFSPPENEFSLLCRLIFYGSLENIGNGSAVAIDIVPKLLYQGKTGKIVAIEPVFQRVESLKPNQKVEIHSMFVGEQESPEGIMHECILRNYINNELISQIELNVFYRNVLGACFRSRVLFDIWFYEEDQEKIKSCAKLLETAKIDFADEIRKYTALKKDNRDTEADVLIEKMNEKLSQNEGCANIPISLELRRGSFSVTPISLHDYEKELGRKVYPRRVSPPKKSKMNAPQNQKGQCAAREDI